MPPISHCVHRAGVNAGAQSYFYYRPTATPGVFFLSIPWGVGGDQSMRGNFDCDGKADLAVWRSGLYIILRSTDGGITYLPWG